MQRKIKGRCELVRKPEIQHVRMLNRLIMIRICVVKFDCLFVKMFVEINGTRVD